ncbi:NAD(P)H-binding protein [Pseudomonas sp. MWU12-2029]|uniref:NAD(P)H-binding protein n=1 Tax=Pseudomonas sp. MWU12-2029 TaxID=2927805 RepID=UPI00200F45B3|nr:NAD(P)H-binding protein [Pseudomonas sp. MWU12-2029]
MTNSEAQPFLILGATGKTGSRISKRLIEDGHPVRPGSRNATIPFDWDYPSTWSAALTGARAVYISYQPDLAMPGALETLQAFVSLAVEHHVKHLVLLSGRGEIEAQEAERIVQNSGIDWTILRASWFFQNFSEAHFLDPIIEGQLVLPVGNIAEPFVDAEDIAEVAVQVLTKPGHKGKFYELTGPRALTFYEALEEISSATGRDIQFTQVSAQAYLKELEHRQLPTPYVNLLLYLFTTVLDGRNAAVADGVKQALGRPANDFSAYARRTASTGIWNAR